MLEKFFQESDVQSGQFPRSFLLILVKDKEENEERGTAPGAQGFKFGVDVPNDGYEDLKPSNWDEVIALVKAGKWRCESFQWPYGTAQERLDQVRAMRDSGKICESTFQTYVHVDKELLGLL